MTFVLSSELVPPSATEVAARPSFRAAASRWLFVTPVILALVVTTVYPTLFLIALALSKSTLGKPFRGFAGLKPILTVLADPLFAATVARSIAFAVVTAVIELALGFAIALLFTSFLRAGRFLTSLILLPLMTPP